MLKFPGVSVTDVSADLANKAKSTVCLQEDLMYVCTPLKLSAVVMPKLMVSLAVVSRVPSRWYSFSWRCLGSCT